MFGSRPSDPEIFFLFTKKKSVYIVNQTYFWVYKGVKYSEGFNFDTSAVRDYGGFQKKSETCTLPTVVMLHAPSWFRSTVVSNYRCTDFPKTKISVFLNHDVFENHYDNML